MQWIAGFQYDAALEVVTSENQGEQSAKSEEIQDKISPVIHVDIAKHEEIEDYVMTWSNILALKKDGSIIPVDALAFDASGITKVTNVGEKIALVSFGRVYVSDKECCGEVKLEGDKIKVEGDGAEGDKVKLEGDKIKVEGDGAEGDKVKLEGDKIKVEGDGAEGDNVKLEGDGADEVHDISGTENKLIVLYDNAVSCVDIPVQLSQGQEIHLQPECKFLKMSITSVSCGKEHSLLLSSTGILYSFGGGSRGQLGHGDVENRDSPTEITSLTGVRMVSVAAGGWHSTALSEFGDVYVWGWNQSGQLGLPCNSVHRNRKDTKIDQKCRELKDFVAEDKEGLKAEKCAGSGDHNPDTNTVLPSSVQTSNILSSTDTLQSQMFVPDMKCVESFDYIIQKDIKGADTMSPPSVQTSNTLSSIDTLESRIVIQDVDVVQVQPEPCILDLLESVKIKKIACGSRHTVLLTETGYLLSCGWNDYGQLCHGDTQSRDHLETVDFFIRKNVKVIDVHCAYWSTLIITMDTS